MLSANMFILNRLENGQKSQKLKKLINVLKFNDSLKHFLEIFIKTLLKMFTIFIRNKQDLLKC